MKLTSSVYSLKIVPTVHYITHAEKMEKQMCDSSSRKSSANATQEGLKQMYGFQYVKFSMVIFS